MHLLPARLDRLSDEALRNVVRRLSSVPSRQDWISFIEHRDALAAIGIFGSLSSVARPLFPHLCLGTHETAMVDRGEQGAVHLPGNISTLLEWAQTSGKSSTSLTVGANLDTANSNIDDKSLADIVCALKESCSSLRRLDIGQTYDNFPAGRLLHALQGQLKELVANALHGANLAGTCSGLQILTLRDPPRNMGALLQAVGPTLLSFEITHPSQRILPEMPAVQAFCPRLIRIVFKDILVPREKKAYGDQLRFAFWALCLMLCVVRL